MKFMVALSMLLILGCNKNQAKIKFAPCESCGQFSADELKSFDAGFIVDLARMNIVEKRLYIDKSDGFKYLGGLSSSQELPSPLSLSVENRFLKIIAKKTDSQIIICGGCPSNPFSMKLMTMNSSNLKDYVLMSSFDEQPGLSNHKALRLHKIDSDEALTITFRIK